MNVPTTGNITSTTDADYFSLTVSDRTAIILQGLSSETNGPTISATVYDSSQTEVPYIYVIPNTVFSNHNRPERLFSVYGVLDPGINTIKLTSSSGTGPYALVLRPYNSYTDFINDCEGLDIRTTAPNDPYYGCQWHLNNTNQHGAGGGQDINVETVWSTVTGEGINVAIVDNSFDFDHADLRDNAIKGNNHDYNGNGDVFDPFETHGTRVAGIIAASPQQYWSERCSSESKNLRV